MVLPLLGISCGSELYGSREQLAGSKHVHLVCCHECNGIHGLHDCHQPRSDVPCLCSMPLSGSCMQPSSASLSMSPE
jgi:hypothetical protein